MADEKPFESVPEENIPETATESEPLAEDLSDSDLEDASGGAFAPADSNGVCGFGC